jgi:competence protein ComEC
MISRATTLAMILFCGCGDDDGASGTDSGRRDSGTTTPRDGGNRDAAGRDAESPGEDAGSEVTGELRIYWVDTEGGAATILVAPNDDVILVDAGNPGDRDPDRIARLLRDELEVDAIDAFIVTHYHSDHVGGVPAIASEFEVGAFYDHGDNIEDGARGLYDDYVEAAEGRRTTVAPGDVLTFGDLTLRIVAAAGELIEAPGGLPPNPHCDGADPGSSPDDENAWSVGFIATFGSFDFLDAGDLTHSREHRLACPVNRLGVVDLFQTTHHGQDSSNARQLVHALDPIAAVTNNGPTKGGHVEVFETLVSGDSFEFMFQLHRAENNDAEHNTDPELISNLEGGGADQAHFTSAVIDADGRVTITNARTGASRSFTSR